MDTGNQQLPTMNPEEPRDLGFGTVLSRHAKLRLLNRNGSFNVGRPHRSLMDRLTSYHTLLTISWPRFMVMLIALYLVANAVFALLYLACGQQALRGESVTPGFWRAFFFSVQTFSTVGFGDIIPMGMAANFIVTLESLCGLLTFAFATGLLFARFSRPTANIIYSDYAVVAPYRDITAFMFRIVNGRDNQLIDLQARITVSRFEDIEGKRERRYFQLKLERSHVAFFPLSWTVVHPITPDSPLFGWDHGRMVETETEFLILLTATDETFAQSVHSRSSYSAPEVKWMRRFSPAFAEAGGVPRVDMKRFHATEPA